MKQSLVMQIDISSSVPSIDQRKRHWPAVSIIMPFEPAIQRKDDLMQKLQKAMKKVEWEMGTGYDDDLAGLVMLKLNTIIKNLNFSTFRKSIAIYVSPVFEKVMYMSMPVHETITINESFLIRDIVHARKEVPAYLVVVLSEKWSTVYEGHASGLVKIKSNGAGNMPDPWPGVMERGDPGGDTFVKRFLQHIDEGLSILLSVMPLPVLVLGNKNVLANFKSLTTNGKSVVECIEGRYEKAAETTLFNKIHPYIADWDKIKIKHLYHQLEKAATGGKLVSGMAAVQQSVLHHRNQLLVIGKSLMDSAEMPETGKLPGSTNRFNKFSCVRHLIDDIIEKVLENGGDIQMVDDDVLGDHHIVLVNGMHDHI